MSQRTLGVWQGDVLMGVAVHSFLHNIIADLMCQPTATRSDISAPLALHVSVDKPLA